MSHLEDLLFEWFDWRGYVVKRNIKVGRLSHGGWEGELDIVAYNPTTGDLVHMEPSVDAHSWKIREERFRKKFRSGRNYIYKRVFPWLSKDTKLRQVAVLVSRGKRDKLAGGDVTTIDEIVGEIRRDVEARGKLAKAAIPEQYRLLRTIQLVQNGYHRVPKPAPDANVPPEKQPPRRNAMRHNWTEEDDLVALYLYRFGFDVVSLEEVETALRIPADTMSMRISNFKALHGEGGLGNAAKQSRAIYERYHDTPREEQERLVLDILRRGRP